MLKVAIPSQVTYWSWEALPERQQGLGVPPGVRVGVERPSQMARRG